MKARITIVWMLALVPFSAAFSQNSITLRLSDAEQLFLRNNASLIAQRFQVEQSKADIITAGLFENPELSYENLLYNQETGKFLQTSQASGQYTASITQLFKLAGKRNKDIHVAETASKMESIVYADLMRTLKFELRSTFYQAYYAERNLAMYDQLISSLTQLLNASEQQLKFGNIAGKDVIRIKSRLYSLQLEHVNNQNDLEVLKGQLKLLTGLEAAADIRLDGQGIDARRFNVQNISFPVLLDSAKTSRADLHLAKTGLTFAQNLLAVQKAKAVPDVAISLNYDLKGNYPEKYTGIGISVPIPLFNRNQGEIKKARISIDAATAEINRKEAEVASELFTSYQAALKIERLFSQMDEQFSGNFELLMEGVFRNYKDRNISLLEFLDFYDSYKDSTTQLNEVLNRLMTAREELNFQTGTNIFK
jgi:cobalt-zinc-cadmium efflux system outer membrane protein